MGRHKSLTVEKKVIEADIKRRIGEEKNRAMIISRLILIKPPMVGRELLKLQRVLVWWRELSASGWKDGNIQSLKGPSGICRRQDAKINRRKEKGNEEISGSKRNVVPERYCWTHKDRIQHWIFREAVEENTVRIWSFRKRAIIRMQKSSGPTDLISTYSMDMVL